VIAQHRVSILIEQGFVPTELALVKDVLRIANRLGHAVWFDCQTCTTGGSDLVEGLGEVLIRASALEKESAELPDCLIVLGGDGIRARFDSIKSHLCRLERNGRSVILMSDAAAEWRRLFPDHGRMTIHWEKHQADCDVENRQMTALPLYARIGRVTTAAGMTAAADVVLATVIAPLSPHLAEAVANVMVLERIRDGSVCQPRSVNQTALEGQCKLHQVIAAMEANVEEPLTVTDLAKTADLSVRQFERNFKALMGLPPNAFYRMVRLRRAKALLEQTMLSINEIAMACGFNSTSRFSRHYADAFGDLPSRRRSQLTKRVAPMLAARKLQGNGYAGVPFSTPVVCASSRTV
jgi:transcriptional regulator GlxA family with amidase domain